MSTVLVPGPVERDDFFEEQARRRRQTWRSAALSAVAAAIVGVPLAMFLTPIAFLVTIAVLRGLERTVPIPQALWDHLREVAQFVPAFLGALGDSTEEEVIPWLRSGAEAVDFPFGSPLLTIAALILPGMVTMVLIWLGYRALFATAGIGGTLLALGSREPNPDDLEERQLVNLVEEMAIAAGLPPPKMRMIDSPIPNAAAVGASHENAVVLVTRGLLDNLDRDETQGVIGHVVGSIGNGDLRVFTSITTAFQSIELVFTMLDALFNLSPAAWKSLFYTARLAATGGRDHRAAELLASMMDHRLGEFREDGIAAVLSDAHSEKPKTALGKFFRWLPFLQIVFLPFLLLHILALFLAMQVRMFKAMVVGPLLMRILRTRRYLADATAVQLTRNPDGLATALARLAELGGPVPGGQWFAHLFIVGPEAVLARNNEAFRRRLAGLRENMGKEGHPGTLGTARQAVAHTMEAMREDTATRKGTWADELSGSPSHPPIVDRMYRLERLGAQARPREEAGKITYEFPLQPRRTVFGILGVIVLTPLFAIATILGVVAVGMIFAFGAVAAVALMGLAMAGVYALLA